MRTIERMISEILAQEGGYIHRSDEEGGPTHFGITQKNLSGFFGRYASLEELQLLSPTVASKIYKRNYYQAPKIDRLPQAIQPFVFDCAVNHAPRRAIKMVQTVCNDLGVYPILIEDGAMGPKTRRAAQWADRKFGSLFLKSLIEERKRFYRQIFACRPGQRILYEQWISHVQMFEQSIA